MKLRLGIEVFLFIQTDLLVKDRLTASRWLHASLEMSQ